MFARLAKELRTAEYIDYAANNTWDVDERGQVLNDKWKDDEQGRRVRVEMRTHRGLRHSTLICEQRRNMWHVRSGEVDPSNMRQRVERFITPPDAVTLAVSNELSSPFRGNGQPSEKAKRRVHAWMDQIGDRWTGRVLIILAPYVDEDVPDYATFIRDYVSFIASIAEERVANPRTAPIAVLMPAQWDDRTRDTVTKWRVTQWEVAHPR